MWFLTASMQVPKNRAKTQFIHSQHHHQAGTSVAPIHQSHESPQGLTSRLGNIGGQLSPLSLDSVGTLAGLRVSGSAPPNGDLGAYSPSPTGPHRAPASIYCNGTRDGSDVTGGEGDGVARTDTGTAMETETGSLGLRPQLGMAMGMGMASLRRTSQQFKHCWERGATGVK